MNDVDVHPTSRKARRAGLIGAVAGLAAAGVAAGVATERYLVNKARTDPDDPFVDEPFGILPADRTRTISTADGIPIHVETVGANAEVGSTEVTPPVATVVFVHGYCLDQGTFHFQRRALTGSDLPVRAVYYDQPGHGRSGELPTPEYSIDELAEALYSVIAQTAPTGPLILVGHSMGAMTIMAFARRHPQLCAERLKGVAFLSTSAGGLDQVAYGAPRMLSRARRIFMPTLGRLASFTPGAIDRTRKMATDLAWMLTRRYGFASPKPSASLVSYVETMNTATPIQSVIGYSRTLLEHDEYDSLSAFSGIPVFISCGDSDHFTPADHSQLLADRLPHAEIQLVPSAAHVALMEKPDTVNIALLAHLEAIVSHLEAAGSESSDGKRRMPWRRKRKEDGG